MGSTKETEYDGHWIETYSGNKFHYLAPSPEEINIEDIAHALSLTCRFGGHTSEFYSVAQHSVLCSVCVEVSDLWTEMAALLHDGAEAYIPDIPRPIKYDMPYQVRQMESVIQEAIYRKFIPDWDRYFWEDDVKFIDNKLLATEARVLMKNTSDWADLPEPLSLPIIPWTPHVAEESFLSRFKQLKELLWQLSLESI